MDWRTLNQELLLYDEAKVRQLLEEEQAGPRRAAFLERLHQRYTALRSARERNELLKRAKQP